MRKRIISCLYFLFFLIYLLVYSEFVWVLLCFFVCLFVFYFNKRHLFITVSETGKSKNKVLADSIPGEGSLLGLQTTAFLLCPHVVERERQQALWCLSYNNINLIRSRLHHMTSFNLNYLLRGSVSKYSHISG